VSVDRELTVKKAEDLVREGKHDLAIEEYLRLVDDQPGDVGAANALGDLYAKVGSRGQAASQFVRIGDTHRESGFIPKAIAFYKKALKVDPASDHALSQLAQIAVEQELYADATLYVNRLLERRREQHNEAGVAECLVRLGGFPSATADAKLAAARAAAGHVAAAEAARLWVNAADALERAGRPREAVDVLMHAASLDTEDVALRRRVAVACADTGQIERARAFLSFETAGDRGDLLMALAKQALADGRDAEARRALERVIEVAPDERSDAEALLAPLRPHGPSEEADEIIIDSFDVPDTAAAPAAEEWSAESPPQDEPAIAEEAEVVPMVPAEAGEAGESLPDAAILVALDEPAPVPGPGPEAPPPVAAAAGPPAIAAADASTIASLTVAAQNPALQFQASAQLGRLLLRLDRAREGVEWLERAAQTTSAVREQRLDVMYELADALERVGEPVRALEVFADLDFDAASYRDVPARMARLRRVLEAGGAT